MENDAVMDVKTFFGEMEAERSAMDAFREWTNIDYEDYKKGWRVKKILTIF
ncbi:hypothetical protein HZF08_01725 [Paenibacillus sp. CGMCC 1.16610]|uniref:Uncharacterized protein n=1 Tax=Paenibacillus anseongense TaxID=2682845 RepID=A0ABW9U358_9BACL|nr:MULTISPECIES: hypothetical protein [Paenibacillus]MBA2937019.1 hypothetical protein [Paenibacillus sp. CGMCC 1.16610]MVQ33343.1 hypothetical protein [Paenibacillus anseongense]